jgi:hypothetical protein
VQFTLAGFSQVGDIRHFTFERVTADRTHIQYTVDADLGELRTFRIALQELPLMCRRLLEALPEDTGPRRLNLTKEDMRQHAEAANAVLERAAQRKRTSFSGRKPGQPSPFGQMRTPAPTLPFVPGHLRPLATKS